MLQLQDATAFCDPKQCFKNGSQMGHTKNENFGNI